METHYRTCNLCEAMCGVVIQTEDGRVTSIKGDKEDPFSQGHVCPKATALQDIYEDPDRLKRPIKRTENGWEEISWDEAFDLVVDGLVGIQDRYGGDAVGIYQGNPNVHNTGSMLYSPQFVRALRTKNRFSATSVDQLPHHYAAYYMFGHQFMIPIPDIDRTDFMVLLGANPLASNGSLMTAPGVKRRLKAIQARDGRVITIDPRRTETAEMADQHIFVKPGTDVLILLGMLHTMFADNLIAPREMLALLHGEQIGELEQFIMPFTPEAVSGGCGVSAETIRQLARDFCAAESAVLYGRMGTSVQAFGGTCNWLINCINLLSGNIDREGGAMFTLPAFDLVGITTMMGSVGNHGRWHSRVRNLPEFTGELPVSALAEDILTEGDGQIKAMVTIAGNPVLSTPNGHQMDEAFAQLDFMVSIDIYLNETTRHANVILPPTTGLETDHYDIVFHALAVRNTAKFSSAVFEPSDGAMHDWQIYAELRDRLLAKKGKSRPTNGRDLFVLPPEKILDVALRNGPYGAWGEGGRLYERDGNGASIRELKKHPHGLDLGGLRPCLAERIVTKDKKINLVPELFVADLARAEALLNRDVAEGELLLIGRRQLRSNNSWMHNSKRLVKGKNRCTLLMHPDDATERGLEAAVTAQIRSRVGTIEAEVEVSDEIMPGVVSIPHGWGHNRPGIQLSVAQEHAGVSINDLTDDQAIDVVTGNAVLNGVPVMVQAV